MSTLAVSETMNQSVNVSRPTLRPNLVQPTPNDPGQLIRMQPLREETQPPPTFPTQTEQFQVDPDANSQALVIEMSRTISIAAMEIINGARSIQQLARWLDPRCFNALATRARLHAEACALKERRSPISGQAENVVTLHRKPMIHSIHCFFVTEGIFETSVVIADGARFRAMALRLEETRCMWKVTALRIG